MIRFDIFFMFMRYMAGKKGTKEILLFILSRCVRYVLHIEFQKKELRKIKHLNIWKWLRWKYWVTQLRFYSSFYFSLHPSSFRFDRIIYATVENIIFENVQFCSWQKRGKLFWIKIKLFKLCIRSKVIEFYGYFIGLSLTTL